MSNVPNNFTHLEVHSHYTLLGGTVSIRDLVDRAARDKLSALALTDTNSMYGVVQFSSYCQRLNIKPVIGMVVVLKTLSGTMPSDNLTGGQLVLLADGVDGYRSLCRISSYLQSGANNAQVSEKRMDWEMLRANRSGLICLSGGRRGWIEQLLRTGQPKLAARYASQLGGMFENRFYLSFCPADPLNSTELTLFDMGERFGLPIVATRPIYCLDPQEVKRLRLLAAIAQNRRLDELNLPHYDDSTFPLHWPSQKETSERYAAYPQALATAGDIIERCEPGLPDGRPIWPVFNLSQNRTPEEALNDAVYAGICRKYGASPTPEVEARKKREIKVISESGFAPLFLVVSDIVRFARETGIPVSTRGSVANSLVAYCMGITHVDPIEHDLLFERFLNPARSSLPDIDLDFCSRRRDEVLNYVRGTYGADKVALVGTMSTLQLRSALRETAKAYGLDDSQLKKLAAKIPRRWHPDPRRRQGWQISEVLSQIDNELMREVLRQAFDIVGQPHHLSIHPGGIVLTPGALTDIVPVQMAPKGFLVTQYDYRDVERIGLPKLDLLGIRALTVLSDAETLIQGNHDPEFKLTNIPAEDSITAVLLSSGATIGVFQCESSGARRTLRKLRAKNIADLAVANAFFKPGPATGGMAKAFVRRYRGEEAVQYLHPALEPILSSTKGVLLFQEQILRIAREIAGLTWTQADGLRKGMSKFQPQEMELLESNFLSGCMRAQPDGPGFSGEQAAKLWEQVVAFAGYGFNKGHATAYADVSYRSAYLKAHYPSEFLCARLADRGGFHHPAIYIAEARRLGIGVRPPHINYSERRFTLTIDDIKSSRKHGQEILWLGLGQIRDLRRKTAAAIIDERRRRKFRDLADLLSRVPMQKKEIRHLICCGALDGLGESRASNLVDAEHIIRAGSAHQLAFDFARQPSFALETDAMRLKWEMDLLGMPVTVHPLELISEEVSTVPLGKLPGVKNQLVTIQGVRLPGWTGEKGFFLSEAEQYIVVVPTKS
ncbi:MAG: DNA polymerase III subunit alpha, partial [Candidatus Promineifilaceae bacterium]|nr:DNA polymerase III subunit alpha [Candidatus Promineifilaceae bacterium]